MTSSSPNSTGWREALEIVVAMTRHERFRWLCSDENPDAASRRGYRARVVRIAAEGLDPPTPEDLALRALVAKSGGCCGH